MAAIENLPLWISIPAAILLILSGIITLVGSIGLVRLVNFYSRVHAPTMGNTLGVFTLLLASIIIFSYVEQRLVIQELFITLLLVITSPATAILLMRAAIKRRLRKKSLRPGPSDMD